MRTVGTISIFLFLVVCAAIDLKKRSLPMWLLWAGSLGVLLISLWNTRLNLFPLFQGAVPGIVLGIISWITREAVGYGDVWIITLLGIYLGIWDTATLVCIAFFFSSIAAVGCLVWKKFRRDTRIPFVPFLTAAYVGGGFFMRMKASATIEAAVACSVFFLSFFLVIRGVFYYHDKNILMGTAYEAAVVHSQKKRSPEACTIAETEQSFEIAARKRMLLFSAVNLTIEETDQKITVQGIAWKGKMKISVSQSAAVTEPEKFIRNMRKAGIHEDGG